MDVVLARFIPMPVMVGWFVAQMVVIIVSHQ
jgi:hypothetical protein